VKDTPCKAGERLDGSHEGAEGGGHYRDEEMHLWTFNEDGKVTRLRHNTDTAKHIAAFQG
jgi:ketosteroid isomerase-like protein